MTDSTDLQRLTYKDRPTHNLLLHNPVLYCLHHHLVAGSGSDPPTSGLWAQHASTAPPCSGSSERDKSGDSRSSDLNLEYFVWTLESWKELCGTAILVKLNFVVNQL